jgi:hypothetical protein
MKKNIFFTALMLSIIVLSCTKQSTPQSPTNPPKPLNETYPGGSYASALLPAGDTIKSFSTTWVVPDNPPADSTIFWWNGLDGGACQPVLQWEYGNWTISNWYFNDDLDGQGPTYHHSPFIAVTPGTKLTGVITLASYTANSFTYTESFTGYPAADVTFTRTTLAAGLVEDQEAYTNTYLALPKQTKVQMTGINCVLTNGNHPPNLNWTFDQGTYTTPLGYPQILVVSPSSSNGELDFYEQ